VFNLTHSLHRKFRDAKAFYASYTLVVVLAAGIVLIPGAPLGLLTTAVQALAGVLLPSASVFLLLLCNDSEVLGPWTNPRWLNGIAGIIIGLLLTLSGTLVVTTLFPSLSAPEVVVWIAGSLAAGSAAAYGWLRLRGARPPVPASADFATMSRSERARWRMPPLALLKPVAWSPVMKLTIVVMWVYLVISVLLLIVKAVQLAAG
ncbi:MAG: divalent metal cation transporter, partial [Nocardiopsaceae bacterium]|jgi:hypothetical protein|nr:divalent metal cation transporter [Nocardiopsaceae bacterium]